MKSPMAGLHISGKDKLYSKELTITHPMGIRWLLTFTVPAAEQEVSITLEELTACCLARYRYKTECGLLSRWEKEVQREETEIGLWLCSECHNVHDASSEPNYFRGSPQMLDRLETIITVWLTPLMTNALNDSIAAYDLKVLLQNYCINAGLTEASSWGFFEVIPSPQA